MSDDFKQTRVTVYRVNYRFRIKRRSSGVCWKKRYKWRYDSRIVRCASCFEVEDKLTEYIRSTFTRNEYEVKIELISQAN